MNGVENDKIFPDASNLQATKAGCNGCKLHLCQHLPMLAEL